MEANNGKNLTLPPIGTKLLIILADLTDADINLAGTVLNIVRGPNSEGVLDDLALIAFEELGEKEGRS